MTDDRGPDRSDSDKLEREIEDVLEKIEDFEWHRRRRRGPSRSRRAWSRVWHGASNALGHRFAQFTAGHVMLVGFLLLIVGLALRGRGPGLWLVLAGILLFFVGLGLSMRSGERKAGGGYTARGGYWRDRYVTYDDDPHAGPTNGLLRWLRRKRR
jgi:hypothetical protein